jgi:glutathione S-transferase
MMIKLYDTAVSGHCHRVRLFLSLLGLPYNKYPIDMKAGQHKTDAYLTLSPLGQVPTLVDGPTVITDSTAALVYLAIKYGDDHWLPRDAEGAARVQRWLSTASGELYRGPVQARAGKLFGRDVDMDKALAESERLFKWMESALAHRTWLASTHPTIADIAMYSYIALANEGGLDLTIYPAIMDWLARVEALPGFEPVQRSAP